MKGCTKGKGYWHCRIKPPGNFDKRSFRTVSKDGAKLVIACPKGKYNASTKRCTVSTQVQKKMIPV